MGLVLALVLSGAQARAGLPPQTADPARQVSEHRPAQPFDNPRLTPEQQRNLAEAERVVDAVFERLYTTLDVNSVWEDYFDPTAAGPGYGPDPALTTELEEKIPPELLRRKQVAELNHIVAFMAFLFSYLPWQDWEQFEQVEGLEGLWDRLEFWTFLSADVRTVLRYEDERSEKDRAPLSNEAEVEAFISDLDRATAILRREIPDRWTQQFPAWQTLRLFRELPSQDEHFRPSMHVDDKGRETYLVVRDLWVVELRPRDGHMKITFFGPISE